MTIKLKTPFRDNFFAICSLAIFFIFTIKGLMITHWSASYLNGDSIIPRKNELTELGPFFVSKTTSRITPLMVFTRPDLPIAYQESMLEITITPDVVEQLIRDHSGEAVAYLSIYKNNPVRQIWGIRILGIEILSYPGALSYYEKTNDRGYSWIAAGLIGLILFIASIIEIKRTGNINQPPRDQRGHNKSH